MPEEIDDKPIKINVKMVVTNNPHGIPPGTFMDIGITITDEFAVTRTSHAKFTEDIAKSEKLKPSVPGTIAKYSPRLQKTIVKYPGRSKQEIAKIIGEELKKLPIKQ